LKPQHKNYSVVVWSFLTRQLSTSFVGSPWSSSSPWTNYSRWDSLQGQSQLLWGD